MITDEFKPVTFSEEYANMYWDGWQNFIVRQWTYFREGVNVGNELKYLIVTYVFSIWSSDITIPSWLLIWGGLAAIPLIVIIGRWNLIKANKSRQYFTTIHGNLTGFQGHNMQVFNTELMVGIAEKLGVDVESIRIKFEK